MPLRCPTVIGSAIYNRLVTQSRYVIIQSDKMFNELWHEP